MLWLFPLLLVHVSLSDDVNPEEAIAQRLMSTIPEIPQLIRGSMEGKSDGIKNVISNVLGDGLISQLVVNPIGIAEEVLPDFGLNKSAVMSDLDQMSGGNLKTNVSGSSSLFGKNNALLRLFMTTQRPATTQVMLIDGVPVPDFDDFVRKNNLENHYSTNKPPPPTTAPPDAGQFADQVMNAISSRLTHKSEPVPPHVDDFASTLNMANIDPRRRAEVNNLLRRAPQKFDTMDVFGSPPGFVQEPTNPPLDPVMNDIVTQMRTQQGNLNLQQIAQLKQILNAYEEKQRTEEFIVRRNQLQVLRNELEAHRRKIGEQKKLEEELKKKEKEMETMTLKMQQQLVEQLNHWNLSSMPISGNGIRLNPMDLPELGPKNFPSAINNGPQPPGPMPLSMQDDESQETMEEFVTTSTFSTISYHPKNIRKSPPKRTELPLSTAITKDIDGEFVSSCNCQQISLERLKGRWIPALASRSMLHQIYESLNKMLHQDASSSLACSRFQVWAPKVSSSAQDARVSWEFRSSDMQTTRRITGNALSLDHKTVRVQMRNLHGELSSLPVCVLRTDEDNNYMLITKGSGPCSETVLLVRNPDDFFGNESEELVDYLKKSITSKRLEKLEMLNFATDCEDD